MTRKLNLGSYESLEELIQDTCRLCLKFVDQVLIKGIPDEYCGKLFWIREKMQQKIEQGVRQMVAHCNTRSTTSAGCRRQRNPLERMPLQKSAPGLPDSIVTNKEPYKQGAWRTEPFKSR